MKYTHVTELNELSEEAKAFLMYFVSQDLTNVADKLLSTSGLTQNQTDTSTLESQVCPR